MKKVKQVSWYSHVTLLMGFSQRKLPIPADSSQATGIKAPSTELIDIFQVIWAA